MTKEEERKVKKLLDELYKRCGNPPVFDKEFRTIWLPELNKSEFSEIEWVLADGVFSASFGSILFWLKEQRRERVLTEARERAERDGWPLDWIEIVFDDRR